MITPSSSGRIHLGKTERSPAAREREKRVHGRKL